MAVCEALGLDDWDRVRFYSAVGTPLDIYHGTDAWIELSELSDPNRIAYATLDATMHKEKVRHGGKADVVIGEVTDISEDETKYLEEIEQYGKEIADQLERQAKRRGINIGRIAAK